MTVRESMCRDKMASKTYIVPALVVLCCYISSIHGLLITNQGREFIIGFSAQHIFHAFNGTNRVFLTSDTMATVRLEAPAINLDVSIKLTPGIPRHVDLPGKARMDSKTGVEKKGIRLTSSEKFAVYGMNLLKKSSDGFLGLPVSALGTDYVISTTVPVIGSVLLVVATKDNTWVNIKLRMTGGGTISFKGNKHGNRETFSVRLNALEGFQIVTIATEDLTGTRVTSIKPVSVYSGCDCAYVPVNKPSCDHLVEQIPPVNLLGTQFVTMATANRTGGDLYHVIAAYDGTAVTVDKIVVSTLAVGQRYELDSRSHESHMISTSRPSLVVQYAKSYSVDGSMFDPYMAIVPAVSQYSNDYTLFVPVHLSSAYFDSFVNIAVKTTEVDKIKVMKDGDWNSTTKFSKCSAVPGSEYSTCSMRLISGFYRVYHQSVSAAFALVTYGTWHRESYRESYGFPAGMKVTQSSQVSQSCIVTKTTPADEIDNDCDGKIDEEEFNNVDDDGDGRVDEDVATKPPSIKLPSNFTKLKCANTNFDPSEMGVATGESYGICKLRGPVNITFSDTLTNTTKCGYTLVRKWAVSDACTNIRKANQYIFVRLPEKPVVEFPKDLNLMCRAKNKLTPAETGNAKVVASIPCKVKVTIRYQDSVYFLCSVTERKLMRTWIVEDECGSQTRHQQSIRLLPLASYGEETRNFNVSIILSFDFIARNNETTDQSKSRLLKEVDMALMLSSIADNFLGSSLLHYRLSGSSPVAFLLVKFHRNSKIMPNDLLTNLRIAFITGMLVNITRRREDITVQDFNECLMPEYTTCDKNAACNNTVGSYDCACLDGFVGDGLKCYVPPRITFISSYIEAAIEENITLRCDVHGLPSPKVSWKTNKGRILDRDVGLRSLETLDDGTTRTRLKIQQADNSLLITETTIHDGGMYTCIAKSSLGEVRKFANLTVRKDLIAVQASVTLVGENFDADLRNRDSVRASRLEKELVGQLSLVFNDVVGYQKVEILEFVNGSVKAIFRVVVKGDESRDTHKLIKRKVGEVLFDKVSSGYIGKLEVKKTAEIRGRPPAPDNLQSSDLKPTSVKITWDPPILHQMYGVSLYYIQYKEFGSNIKTWKSVPVTSLTHTLTRLKPGASYMVRAKSQNEYGAGDPSDVLEIATITDQERSTTDWLVLVLIPILGLIIIIFVVICVVRIVRRKGKYNPTASEEISMVHLTRPQRQRNSWRPFKSRKFTLNHETDSDGHYSDVQTTVTKMKRTSETEERLLVVPGEQYLWQEISRDQITLGEMLGEGEFGVVYKGTISDNSGRAMLCAVKRLKRTATETDLKNLLNELEIMASVGHHNNVIDLIGVCISGGPLLAVVEYAENGNLLQYLRSHRQQNYDNMTDYKIDISAANRLKFACEISKGMTHLARMKCVHRDLAARNVLLGESLVAKVSDFGLSRDVYSDNVYEKKTQGKLPARWMAIESLEFGLYSSKSDVWSFGVILWEIETGGATPFASYSVSEIMEHLNAGRRLGRPTDCNRLLYTMMMRCWKSNPDRRPTFETLTHELKELYQQETAYINVKGINDDGNMNDSQPSTSPEKC